MSYYPSFSAPATPAPCIVDQGIVVGKQDMQRLLASLEQVRYLHLQDQTVLSEGEGCILEIVAEPNLATLVANRSLYLNVLSFDYLELGHSPEHGTWFDLVQENRRLRLFPLSNPMEEQDVPMISASAAFEAMVTEVLSAGLDQLDDDDHTAL
ncbi:MAG: hypothetical protein AAGF24_05745 [Cyanobacteria bacterium P01_H01_bin.121]